MRLRSYISRVVLSGAVAALMVPASHAMVITLAPTGIGNNIGVTGKVSTAAPVTAVGGGTLDQAFQIAKFYWESAITDNFALTINYGWGDTGNVNTLAFEQTQTYSGTPNRITQAGIVVKSQSNPGWFADPTPADNSEYGSSATLFANAALCNGAANCVGILTTGIVYSGSAIPIVANNTDLLSVVIHEMGHALGLDVGYAAFLAEPAGFVSVSAPRPDAGAKLFDFGPGNAHLDPAQGNLGGSLMQPSIGTGVRRLPSGADILADCEISQFTGCNLQVSIPEPMPVGLLFTSAMVLFRIRRRLSR